MVKRIIVGSLQFSPTYKSLCCAFGKQCEKKGFDVIYLFSREYEWMLPQSIKDRSIFIGKSNTIKSALIDGVNIKYLYTIYKKFNSYNPDLIYLHNDHPIFNYYISKIARKKGYTFAQHVHEPYVINKKIYGGFTQYWLHLYELYLDRLLANTDIAVISSKVAYILFKKKYASFRGKITEIPLIYEDLGSDESLIQSRIYITLIGPPVPAKSPEIFLKIIDYCHNKKLPFRFLLISRTEQINSVFFNRKNLDIYTNSRISDEEIGNCIRNSIMTITPYKIATQSSSVITSYMYGTPVLSSNVGGLPEVIQHKKTGYIVDLDSSVEDWVEGIKFIKNNLKTMSKNCRNYFIKNFSECNWQKYIGEFF